MKIFVSYSRQDTEFVDRLHRQPRRRWVTPSGRTAGDIPGLTKDQWRAAVVEAIQGIRCRRDRDLAGLDGLEERRARVDGGRREVEAPRPGHPPHEHSARRVREMRVEYEGGFEYELAGIEYVDFTKSSFDDGVDRLSTHLGPVRTTSAYDITELVPDDHPRDRRGTAATTSTGGRSDSSPVQWSQWQPSSGSGSHCGPRRGRTRTRPMVWWSLRRRRRSRGRGRGGHHVRVGAGRGRGSGLGVGRRHDAARLGTSRNDRPGASAGLSREPLQAGERTHTHVRGPPVHRRPQRRRANSGGSAAPRSRGTTTPNRPSGPT